MTQNRRDMDNSVATNSNQPEHNGFSPEFIHFMTQELPDSLGDLARRVAKVKERDRESVEWCQAISRIFWKAREKKAISRAEVAQQMGVGINDVRRFELFGPLSDILGDFMPRYADAIGIPELYVTICEENSIEVVQPSQ